jgi:uracil-DNA glycosylase
VGAAGKCIQKACSIAGIDWATVGRTNVSKRRPPDNKFKECFYETIEEPIYTPTGKLSKKTKKVIRPTDELTAYRADLRRELMERRPNLTVACGNEALEAIVGHAGVVNYRGSIETDQWGAGLKVLAVEHPSYILRGNAKDFWILAHDLKKAKREAEFPEIRRVDFNSWHDPQHDKEMVLADLEYIGNHPELLWTLDVETRAGTLACYSVGYHYEDTLVARCVPIQTTSGAYWSPQEEMEIWRALYETAAANPNLCNQNIEYDIYYLLRYGVEPSGVWLDTMLAHSILYPEFPKGLDFLCSFYLDDVVYYKGEGRNWGAGDRDPELWEYCCKDAVYTLRVVEKIDEELKRRGLWEAYHGISVI